MVEVIISKQEVDGIEELKEMTTKFRELIDDVIVAVEKYTRIDRKVIRNQCSII